MPSSSARRLTGRLLQTVAVLVAAAAVVGVVLWPRDAPVRLGASAGPAAAAAPAAVPATGTAGVSYPGFAYDPALGAPTRDNPQSKLWHQDGAWWALLVNPRSDTVNVFELTDRHAWRDTGTVVDSREDSTADALWDGSALHVASRTPQGAVVYVRATYDAARRGYDVLRGFPVVVATGGTTSVSLTRDGGGRVWTSFVRQDAVHVASATGSDGLRWTEPYPLPVPEAGVTTDDQSSIVAYAGRVGVLWSNQRTGGFHFLSRGNGDPLTAWGSLETALQGEGLADGHVQLAPHSDGRLFAAVKTSRDDVAGATPQDPLVVVLERATAGTWRQHTAGRLGDGMTRPRIVLSEQAGLLHLYTAAPTPGGRIFEKLSELDEVGFAAGRGAVVMAAPGALLNHVTTTKQQVTAGTGVVLVGSDDARRRYHHAELPITRKAAGTP